MNEPLTKPCRVTRRRKKRWKIADLLKSGLTDCYRVANLSTLSQKTKVGIRPPCKGHNRPLSTVVFLYPSKMWAVLCRLYFVMVGCIEQPLKRLAGSFAGRSNLIHSTAQRFKAVGGGYPFFTKEPQ